MESLLILLAIGSILFLAARVHVYNQCEFMAEVSGAIIKEMEAKLEHLHRLDENLDTKPLTDYYENILFGPNGLWNEDRIWAHVFQNNPKRVSILLQYHEDDVERIYDSILKTRVI